jgi:threonine dehydrogenase-like Zn-dependent dehydrogenase
MIPAPSTPLRPLATDLPPTMTAAVLVAPRRFEWTEAPLPLPGPGEALIRVEACGVCASSLPRWEGRPWFTYPGDPGEMGHEGVGEIVALGEDTRGWRLGDAVAFLSNNAYAEYAVAPANALAPIPDELRDARIPGEPLACAWNIHRRAGIEFGDSVAIVGGGFLGRLVAQLADQDAAEIFVISRREPSARTDAQFLFPESAEAEILRRTGGRLCDVVIEATGCQAPLDLAGRLTRERGRLVIAGYHQDGPRQVDMQLWNWRGLDVINAHERKPAAYVEGMRRAYAAVLEGLLDPAPLLTHHLPLRELGHAFDLAASRPEGFLKAVVHP